VQRSCEQQQQQWWHGYVATEHQLGYVLAHRCSCLAQSGLSSVELELS
jgi:hypothetical protein